MGKIELAVFDVDGVVLDSHWVIEAVNRALSRFGGQLIESDWYQKNTLGRHHDFLAARGIAQSTFEAFDQVFEELLAQAEQYQERAGIREIFCLLKRQGIPIHLASACNSALTHRKVRHHPGLIEFIDQIHGGEKKSDTFVHLAKELGLDFPQILFITDMERDIHEASLAGPVQVLAVTSCFSTRHQLERHGCPVAEDHQTLLSLLSTLL